MKKKTYTEEQLQKQIKAAYRRGVQSAAGFADEWNNQIVGTPYRFGDIILGKHNMRKKSKLRKKKCPSALAKSVDVDVSYHFSACGNTACYSMLGADKKMHSFMYGVPLSELGFGLLDGSKFRVIVFPLPSPAAKKPVNPWRND